MSSNIKHILWEIDDKNIMYHYYRWMIDDIPNSVYLYGNNILHPEYRGCFQRIDIVGNHLNFYSL